jgi:AraC-like DNA-binding protein
MRSGQQKNVLISRYIEVAPITLLRTRYTKHKFAFHYHAEAVVAFVVCGEEWFEICDETIRGAPGAVVFMNPYEPHRGWTDTDAPTDYRAMHIPTDLLRTISGSHTKFTTRIVQSKKLVADLSEWHDILSSSQDLELCRGALKGLLARLRDYVAPVLIEKIGIGESVAEIARDAILCNIQTPEKVQELASVLRVSESYLYRVFKRRYGLSPHKLRVQARALAALQLMRSGTSVAEAGFATGFTDQSHLTRTFKAVFGVTPGQCDPIVTKKQWALKVPKVAIDHQLRSPDPLAGNISLQIGSTGVCEPDSDD